MLIELKQSDIEDVTNTYIDMYGEIPENFNKVLIAGEQLRKEGFHPIYYYDDNNKTILVNALEN